MEHERNVYHPHFVFRRAETAFLNGKLIHLHREHKNFDWNNFNNSLLHLYDDDALIKFMVHLGCGPIFTEHGPRVLSREETEAYILH
eukprot:TRINITY_DN14130_c0_g1_i1.p1 TRINITY_DN14130_c0_g1~~TRINITY_DN14130_c0_g1_i1.p1  ORF type:complete len:102 (+),score=14.26 TRINITY_DN14130_c0_g1_i1:46-306(+)